MVLKMVKIPQQLRGQKFIKLTKTDDFTRCKTPCEKGWTKNANYSHAQFELFNEYKYGVMCGINNLLVIDCDSKEFQDKCEADPMFQKTFTCKTANKQLHHYYFYSNKNNTVRLDANNKRIADIQGIGTQVVGPNSKMETLDTLYEVVRDNEIVTVDYDELITACKSFLPNTTDSTPEKSTKNRKQPTQIYDEEIDPVIGYIKSKLTIRDLLEQWGIDTTQSTNCNCPFHSSESEACFSHDDHQFNCFHCNRGGSMFDLVGEYYKENFISSKNRLADLVGIPEKTIKEAHKLAVKAKKAEASEYLVSQFLSTNNVKTTRNDIKTEVWVYQDGIYVPNGKSYIGQYVRAMLQKFYTPNIFNLIVDKIMKDTLVEEHEFFNTCYPDELPVMNGILNIHTKRITKFTPDKIFFNKLPVYYEKGKDCPEVKDFLKSTLPDEETINTIQEAFGYSLWKNNKYKKAFLLIGRGDNGKSVLMDLFQNLIGIENISNVSLQDIDGDKFSASGLFGKLVNIHADIGKSKIKESLLFKSAVAGDSIEAHRKFMTPIKFRNYSKFFFAANNVPESDDKSDGFFTRWIILNFPYSFKRQIDYDNLSNKELNTGKYKIADPYIFDKISTKSEMSGLLNWCLEGMNRLTKNRGQFTNTKAIEEVKEFWERNESTMRAFILDKVHFTYEYDDIITAEDLHITYIEYCQDNKLIPETKGDYQRVLNESPIKYGRKKYAVGANDYEHKRVWSGIKLK